MPQRQLTLVCIALLLWGSVAEASPTQTPSAATPAGLKERLTLIPTGSIIEVKLINKQKIRGRLGAVSDSAFEVQHTRSEQVVTEALRFDAVRSVKVTAKGMHFAAKVVVGTLIAIGVVALVGVAICATAGCSD